MRFYIHRLLETASMTSSEVLFTRGSNCNAAYSREVSQFRDFPTFLKSGPGACWIWESIIWAINIGKTRFGLKELDLHFKLSDLKSNRNCNDLYNCSQIICINVWMFAILVWFSCFHQAVGLRNWECYLLFWEVFAHFWIGKGPIFCPRIGLGKSLQLIFHYLISHRLKEYDVRPILSLKIMENKRVLNKHIKSDTWRKLQCKMKTLGCHL